MANVTDGPDAVLVCSNDILNMRAAKPIRNDSTLQAVFQKMDSGSINNIYHLQKQNASTTVLEFNATRPQSGSSLGKHRRAFVCLLVAMVCLVLMYFLRQPCNPNKYKEDDGNIAVAVE
ncbi:hypothetical protein HELRODRAFT_178660 [Helobdella robusta]|uniref:Uncharacterized protein n=1 Tax=Helobdella robusta TaxID=6412 RepID=T1FDI7_HELRO|nr:hypothetical protein HELRODRAFT_178660 [Helobdella robusta]ESN96860.1 hypothetical protein HELRODRAFT_178660 [Helobdella robusta]